jgi:hypothetical protein
MLQVTKARAPREKEMLLLQGQLRREAIKGGKGARNQSNLPSVETDVALAHHCVGHQERFQDRKVI